METSVVSYLTALPSSRLLLAAHQQITQEWWSGRSAYQIYISQFVLDEASRGDPAAAERRTNALQGLQLLDITGDVVALASMLIARGGLPQKARLDAFHVAVATVHGMDYLLTWNCKHIANAAHRAKMEEICRLEGFEPPVICTPMELPQE